MNQPSETFDITARSVELLSNFGIEGAEAHADRYRKAAIRDAKGAAFFGGSGLAIGLMSVIGAVTTPGIIWAALPASIFIVLGAYVAGSAVTEWNAAQRDRKQAEDLKWAVGFVLKPHGQVSEVEHNGRIATLELVSSR